jgi:hypothetical protein
MSEPEAAMEVEAAQASTSEQPTYALALLALVRTAQGQNGIKHGDYMRYRWAQSGLAPGSRP